MEAEPTPQENSHAEEGSKKLKAKSFYEDKPGRLIIRNLQYDVKQKHLKKCFEKFGEVIDISVPLNPESSLNKGFGFIEFKAREDARKAIEAMNAKNYKGRMVSVDFAMSKKKYNKKIEDIIQKNPIKPKTKSKNVEENGKNEVDSWDEGLEEIDEPKPQKQKEFKKPKNDKQFKKDKKRENDVDDGLTLFVRNIDYSTTEEDLEEFFGDFGEVQFAKLVKSHDNPQVHKG
jgi:nucleolar protein 4